MNVRQKNQNGNKVRFSGSGGNCGVLATSEFVFVKQYLKCREMLSCSHHIKFKNKLVIIILTYDLSLLMTLEDSEHGKVLRKLADVMIVAGDLVLGTDEGELGFRNS